MSRKDRIDWAAIDRMLAHPNENFVELANAANLDPETDFVRADLRNINFGLCDLTGFNFEGANLDDANLSGAIVDKANWEDIEGEPNGHSASSSVKPSERKKASSQPMRLNRSRHSDSHSWPKTKRPFDISPARSNFSQLPQPAGPGLTRLGSKRSSVRWTMTNSAGSSTACFRNGIMRCPKKFQDATSFWRRLHCCGMRLPSLRGRVRCFLKVLAARASRRRFVRPSRNSLKMIRVGWCSFGKMSSSAWSSPKSISISCREMAGRS